MGDYATIHTLYCAAVNRALAGSGYVLDCTRKGFHTLLEKDGKIFAVMADVEFVRKGACAVDTDKDITISFNHPIEFEDGSLLSLSKIKGYKVATVLFNGEESKLSETVEIEK